MCVEACEGRRSLGIQGESSRSRDTISLSSFSGKQVLNFLSSFLDLLIVILWGFWSKKHDLWDMDVPSGYTFKSRTLKGSHGIKVQTLWPLKPMQALGCHFGLFSSKMPCMEKNMEVLRVHVVSRVQISVYVPWFGVLMAFGSTSKL